MNFVSQKILDTFESAENTRRSPAVPVSQPGWCLGTSSSVLSVPSLSHHLCPRDPSHRVTLSAATRACLSKRRGLWFKPKYNAIFVFRQD